MKELKTVVYEAFDGTIFNDAVACQTYESVKSRAQMVNLRNFEVAFPMQDQVTTCRAYWIPCENAFNIFKAFVIDEYPEFDPTYIEYNGNGWYVVQGDDCGWAQVTKLSDIIEDWGKTMTVIANKTMDFEGV